MQASLLQEDVRFVYENNSLPRRGEFFLTISHMSQKYVLIKSIATKDTLQFLIEFGGLGAQVTSPDDIKRTPDI
jgi:hypothetical protein